jgi:succinate dehydrogenase / fumarate reductase, cytochrome b subunit
MPPIVQSLVRFYQSSIGKKIIVAVTGLAMIGFLVGHLLGNLLIFGGPDAINAYAKKLHDLGPVLYLVRGGLLAMVVIHIVCTIQLVKMNRAARPQKYAIDTVRQASKSSRIMIWTGLTVLAFVIYHLAHFTWALGNQYRDPSIARYWVEPGIHNVYNMVIDGFRVWYVTLFYIIALAMLTSHLSHGFSSVFQTLGLATPRTRQPINVAGKLFAWGWFLGNLTIPLAILFGLIS